MGVPGTKVTRLCHAEHRVADTGEHAGEAQDEGPRDRRDPSDAEDREQGRPQGDKPPACAGVREHIATLFGTVLVGELLGRVGRVGHGGENGPVRKGGVEGGPYSLSESGSPTRTGRTGR